MFERKTLWDTDYFRFSKADALLVPALRAWMSESASPLGQFLASIEYTSKFKEFTFQDVRKLEAMIVNASVRKADALPPLRVLSKIVSQLNRLMLFSIPQPTVAIHLEPLVNPLVCSDLSLAHRSVEAWLKAEALWLTHLRKSASFKSEKGCNVPFELLLLSAVLHGGILNADLAFALYAAVLDPLKYVKHSATRGYVDLPVAWHGQLGHELRRWYPDDALLCLLARLVECEPLPPNADYSGQRTTFCNRMIRRLTAELLRNDVAAELLPHSITDVFQKIVLVLRSEMPNVMVNYATQKIDVRSLLTPSIGLVYGDAGFQSISSESEEASGEVDTENTEGYEGNRLDDELEPSWLGAVRACFHGVGMAELKSRFSKLEMPESMVAQRIIGFAKTLIVHRSSSGHTLKPNSIKCCVLTVARRLGPQLCERDPATVPAETLEDFYVNAIDQAAADSDNPPRLQATVAWTLREFHCYLRREGLAQPLNYMDVFKVPRGFLPVDATIVSVDDVAKALDYLRFEPNSKWSDRHREIARVTILLGFFAGLRTMEGLGALRKDFPGGPLLPFRVLASDTRGLKTINATRMIPMSIFMSPFEDLQKIATAWSQSDAQGDPNASLFDGATDDVIISMVNQTLRAVTGNERVRYYNLRHSFASWSITRLFLSELPDIPNLFPHLPMTSIWLNHSKDFRCSLYGNDRVSNDHAWAIATLLGHSRPNVSLANYCHTLDILLPEFLRVSAALQSSLSHRERLRLSGVDSESGAYVKLPAHGITAGKQSALPNVPCEEIGEHQKIDSVENNTKADQAAALQLREEERIYALTLLRVRHPEFRAPLVQATTHGDRSWMEQTTELLSTASARHQDFDKSVDYLGLTNDEAASIIDRNAEICALKSSKSDKLLHTVTSVAASEEWANKLVSPAIPPVAGLKLAREFASKIERFVEKNLDAPILLDYYCRNVRSESAGLVFRLSECRQSDGIKLVQQYRRLLRGLGIYEADLYFEGSDGTGSDYPCVDWYLSWGLRSRPTCRIINRHGKKAKAVASGEWLSITPSIASHDGAGEFNGTFFDGFRFAMLLAGIRFGRRTMLA
jgi:integrase